MGEIEWPWQYDETGPFMILDLGGEGVHRIDRSSTAIYTHAKNYADVDHVFVCCDEEKAEETGVFTGKVIFRSLFEGFNEFIEQLRKYDFSEIHRAEPDERDYQNWLAVMIQDLDTGIPEDWGGA